MIFCNNVSSEARVQDINLPQLKLKVNDSCKIDQKITAKFEASSPENVKNKGFLDTKLAEVNGNILYM